MMIYSSHVVSTKLITAKSSKVMIEQELHLDVNVHLALIGLAGSPLRLLATGVREICCERMAL
jgi:hypothetical protein